MAQTRYGDLRDTFYLSRLSKYGLLRHADFSASCWMVLFARNHIRGALGTSENEKLTGGVLSGRQEQLNWLPVGSSKVWWSQRDLNPCLSLERAPS